MIKSVNNISENIIQVKYTPELSDSEGFCDDVKTCDFAEGKIIKEEEKKMNACCLQIAEDYEEIFHLDS